MGIKFGFDTIYVDLYTLFYVYLNRNTHYYNNICTSGGII